MTTRTLAGWAIAALSVSAMLLAACGNSSSANVRPSPTTSATGTAPSAAATPAQPGTAGAAEVRAIEGAGEPTAAWRFDPAQVTVAAGASVTFTDAGKEAHTATADDGPFDTGVLNPGDSKTVAFDHAGTFSFHCSLHPWMKGVITVTGAASDSAGSNSNYGY